MNLVCQHSWSFGSDRVPNVLSERETLRLPFPSTTSVYPFAFRESHCYAMVYTSTVTIIRLIRYACVMQIHVPSRDNPLWTTAYLHRTKLCTHFGEITKPTAKDDHIALKTLHSTNHPNVPAAGGSIGGKKSSEPPLISVNINNK
jgi:hypothetical protein